MQSRAAVVLTSLVVQDPEVLTLKSLQSVLRVHICGSSARCSYVAIAVHKANGHIYLHVTKLVATRGPAFVTQTVAVFFDTWALCYQRSAVCRHADVIKVGQAHIQILQRTGQQSISNLGCTAALRQKVLLLWDKQTMQTPVHQHRISKEGNMRTYSDTAADMMTIVRRTLSCRRRERNNGDGIHRSAVNACAGGRRNTLNAGPAPRNPWAGWEIRSTAVARCLTWRPWLIPPSDTMP